GFRGREKAVASERELDRCHSNCAQRLRHFRYKVGRFFADELERDVQRLRSHPAHVGSKSAQAVDEPGHPLADGIVDIKRNKESHEHSLERRSHYIERLASSPVDGRDARRSTKNHQLSATSAFFVSCRARVE